MGVLNTVAEWLNILKINNSDKQYIDNFQQKKLRQLLRHAVNKSEFYQDLYKDIDIDNCHLQDLPIVTKAAMMDNYDRFVTDKRLKLHQIQKWVDDKRNDGRFYLGEFSPFMTSGSTGTNATITYHRNDIDVIQASMFANYPFANRSRYEQIKKIGGYVFGSKPRVAAILLPRGNIEPLFKRVPIQHRLFINMKIFSMLDPLEEIVEKLNRFKPDQLTSYTFFIALLAQEQLAGRLNLSLNQPMSIIAGCGEVLTEHTLELASRAWNTKIQDTYGAMECYLMATSCIEYGCLHQLSNLCILEIVDRHFNPVPRGQYGEKILLTNLFNFTQPIIRYEIDDVTGYAGNRCECGSPFPTLLRVQGRLADFLYFEKPNGGYEQFPPNIFNAWLFYMHDLRQYQIVQSERNELTFFYVSQNSSIDIDAKLKQALKKALAQKGLENRVKLNIKRVDSIARDERSRKFKPIISMEPPGDLEAT